VKTISPNTIIFSDIGPHIRWVGNEKGIAGETNWNYLDTVGFTPGAGAPPVDTLNRGNVNGKTWIPAECDVSIRPGWFYHKEEDDKVKSPEQLFQLFLKSVGRGANLLLNVPPDRRGLIDEKDSATLIAFKKLRDESFRHNVLAEKAANFEGRPHNSRVVISLTIDQPKQIDCIVLRELLANGQDIQDFQVTLVNDKNEKISIKGTTIGRKRILTFPEYEVKKIYLEVQGKSSPSVPGIEAFLIDKNLIEK